jgi:SAM-dependent methyltransferase
MKVLNSMGFHHTAWSTRRLHCPVGREELVLDVGSGGNPYPRANVLLEASEETVERFYEKLVTDRPTVFGKAENLPFRDKSFDFVVASHVLEHSKDPEKFLNEQMRVAKAGYIETPDGFFERINPFRFHRLEVVETNNKLLIFKKPSWRHDASIVDLYESKLKCPQFLKFTRRFPQPFYVRHYWQDKIEFEVVNPDTACDWDIPEIQDRRLISRSSLRTMFLVLARRVCSQTRRNRNIDLLGLLQCPICAASDLMKRDRFVACQTCGQIYEMRNDIPIMRV